jgi:hypothetical protein
MGLLSSMKDLCLISSTGTCNQATFLKKKSSILLDENFEPRVDFGLGRIISACKTHDSTNIARIFAYNIPPEYDMTM